MQRANRREVPRNEQRDHPREAPSIQARDLFADAPRDLQREPQRTYPGGFPSYEQPQHAAPAQNVAEQDFDRYDYQQPQSYQRPDAAPQGYAEQAYSEPAYNNQPHHNPAFGEQEFADEFAKLDFGVTSGQRPGTLPVPVQADYQQQPVYDEQEADPSRYDEALYGQIAPAPQYQNEQGFQGEQFSYDNYDDAEDETPKRRSGMLIVAGIIALAFVGTGSAYGYKTYFSRSRSGEPPIIRADNSPTKIMAAPSDPNAKVPDRMVGGDGSEKLVSREEAPVDVNSRSVGPRVVFPPLNQNVNPPTASSVSPSPMPGVTANASNGTLPNSDPRPVRTVSIGADQAAGAKPAAPVRTTSTVTPPAAPRTSPVNANASANAPLSLSPQAAPAPAPAGRVAAVTPEPASAGATSGGGYLVSVLSQDSEANASAAFKVTQGKYPSVLASRTPVISRFVDKDGKTHYRAALGPYATYEQAQQMCASYKAAGGQCFSFKN